MFVHFTILFQELIISHISSSISVAQKAVKIVSVDATVRRVNAEADNVHVLLLDVNVIQMFAAIVGLGNNIGLNTRHYRYL